MSSEVTSAASSWLHDFMATFTCHNIRQNLCHLDLVLFDRNNLGRLTRIAITNGTVM